MWTFSYALRLLWMQVDVSLNLTSLANITAGSHGSYIHHAGLDKCFDECNYHDSLKAHLIKGIGYCYITGVKFKCALIG